MIAILDVAYGHMIAGVACVLADHWSDALPSGRLSFRVNVEAAAYEPGQFYLRELPLLREAIARLPQTPDTIVIDGYVWLGSSGQPGLGSHLFRALGETVPVAGIAKTRFRDDTWSIPVCRGDSQRPLFVTAAGTEVAHVAGAVAAMYGPHRIPALLRIADQMARASIG